MTGWQDDRIGRDALLKPINGFAIRHSHLRTRSTLRGIETTWNAPRLTVSTRRTRKPLNTLRGIETTRNRGPLFRFNVHLLENPSTPSGVLKPSSSGATLLKPQNGTAFLENPSTPSGVLKRNCSHCRTTISSSLENPSTPSGVCQTRRQGDKERLW